jgi:hypothetical protein
MESLIILSNLGRVRVLTFREAGDDPQQQAHLREARDSTVEMRTEPLSSLVTDSAGRFAQGGPAGLSAGMSRGEEHGLEAELERQALHRIAAEIGARVAAEGNPPWHLAAPATILPALKKALPAAAKRTLAQTTAADLTKLPLARLEGQFLHNGSVR